jgi:hypothetical protein
MRMRKARTYRKIPILKSNLFPKQKVINIPQKIQQRRKYIAIQAVR